MPSVATFIPMTPTIGSKGVFTLTAPFNTRIGANEVYACKSVRSIDEFFADGADPKKDIYDANGISEAEFNFDHTNEVPIICLESEGSDWVYVPARYVSAYPRMDGIAYRALTLAVVLPAMPVTKDLSVLKDQIVDYCNAHIGVNNVMVLESETSRHVSVSPVQHVINQDSRATLDKGGNFYVQYMKQIETNQRLLNKIAELEQFMADHLSLP